MKDNEIIYDRNMMLEKIRSFPQTYDTLLGESFVNKTAQTIMRRKINTMCKEGDIYRCIIPNTRGRKILFYCLPKDYYVVVKAERYGCSIYMFKEYRRVGRSKYYISIKNSKKLDGNKWENIGDMILFEGDILKII